MNIFISILLGVLFGLLGFCLVLLIGGVLIELYTSRTCTESTELLHVVIGIAMVFSVVVSWFGGKWAYETYKHEDITAIVLQDGTEYSEENSDIDKVYLPTDDKDWYVVEKADGSKIKVAKEHIATIAYGDGTTTDFK